MRVLLLVSLLLTLMLTTLTGVVVAVGRQQPLSGPIVGLRLTDCAPPCWIGITPGVTTLEEASGRIEAIYGANPDYSARLDRSKPGRLRVTIQGRIDTSVRASISLDTHDIRNDVPVLSITTNFATATRYSYTVADLVSLLGAPQRVMYLGPAGNNAYYVALNYGPNSNRGTMIVLRTGQRLDLQERPYWLRFLDTGPVVGGMTQETRLQWYTPWRGFTTFFRYGWN